MQLLLFITNQTESIAPILADFMEKKISGATIVDCKGMLTALDESSVEPPTIFGSLRNFINPEHEAGKMLFVLLEDDRVADAKECIHGACGTLNRPNSGVLFTLPVQSVEGVCNR